MPETPSPDDFRRAIDRIKSAPADELAEELNELRRKLEADVIDVKGSDTVSIGLTESAVLEGSQAVEHDLANPGSIVVHATARPTTISATVRLPTPLVTVTDEASEAGEEPFTLDLALRIVAATFAAMAAGAAGVNAINLAERWSIFAGFVELLRHLVKRSD